VGYVAVVAGGDLTGDKDQPGVGDCLAGDTGSLVMLEDVIKDRV